MRDELLLDLSNVRTAAELHDVLARELAFPSYYGRNWDAFWECVCEPDQSDMPKLLLVRGSKALTRRLWHDAGELHYLLDFLPSHRPECRVRWLDLE